MDPVEEKPIEVQNFSSQAYKFSGENVSEQLNSFSRFTAAGPSKNIPEHPLHAVQCSASDQSQNAMRVLTKLVNLSCRRELPNLFHKLFFVHRYQPCCYQGRQHCPIAVGVILRQLIAKCLAKESNSEAKEIFQRLQLTVGVKSGAEAVIHSTKISYEEILTSSNSSVILQIEFCNAFNSINCSGMLKAVAN